MKRSLLLAILVIAAALSACVPLPQTSTPAPGVGSLAGTNWVLTHYGPAGAPLSTPQASAPTLAIAADGKVSGKAGCNTYFGSLSVNGDQATFSQLGRTLMACDGEIMRLEDAYLAALGAAVSFTLENGQLTLRYQGGNALVFAEM